MHRISLVISIAALLLSGVVLLAHSVSAQSGEEGQLQPADAALYESVTMDCLDVKYKLGEVHRTDRLLRVTLGEGYDNMSSNLMDRLNSRIVQNRLDGGELVRIASEFEEAHATFRENYTEYDDAMLDLLKANCQSRTQTYYLELQETKELRRVVHEDVGTLSTLMQRYHDAFKDLRQEIERSAEEESE